VSMRERGDTTQRGRASPIRDRSAERELLRRRRERERVDSELVAEEVLTWAAAAPGARAPLSMPAFVTLRDLVGQATASGPVCATRSATGGSDLRCDLARAPGRSTVVECSEGRLVLHDLVVSVHRVAKP